MPAQRTGGTAICSPTWLATEHGQEERDDEDQDGQAGPDHRHQRDGEQQERKRQGDVDICLLGLEEGDNRQDPAMILIGFWQV